VKEGYTDEDLLKIVQKNFDLRPWKIIESLDLLKPRYVETARYGHFGRNEEQFTWEKVKELVL